MLRQAASYSVLTRRLVLWADGVLPRVDCSDAPVKAAALGHVGATSAARRRPCQDRDAVR